MAENKLSSDSLKILLSLHQSRMHTMLKEYEKDKDWCWTIDQEMKDIEEPLIRMIMEQIDQENEEKEAETVNGCT